jgi:two-component system, response regulator YesN
MMYTLLIVDDERFAAEGIRNCTEWRLIGVDRVLLAHHGLEAKQLFQSHQIDVMICDIEMPDESGLDLLEWVKTHYPHTESLFLTCHSEFTFVKRAIQLGSVDYLLKPADTEELVQAVIEMLRAVDAKRERRSTDDRYNKFKRLWDKQQPLLAERFWSELLSRRLLTFGDFLTRAIDDAQLPLSPNHYVFPIMISIEGWRRVFGERDKETMEYAVKKAAEELLLEGGAGHALLDRNGLIYVLVCSSCSDIEPSLDKELWGRMAEQFIAMAAEYFYCDVSCYMGRYVVLGELHAVCDDLLQTERMNVTERQAVIWENRKRNSEKSTGLQAPVHMHTRISDWGEYLLKGDLEKLIGLVGDSVEQIGSGGFVDTYVIESYFHDILKVVYQVLNSKGIDVRRSIDLTPWTTAQIRSLAQLRNWAIQLFGSVIDAAIVHKEDGQVIDLAIQYIRDHVSEDISREDVADYVGLNPAYLSRLFRREKGKNLIDYLIGFKMERAKDLLDRTDMTISAIAQSIGYVNFSYFAKVFKRIYGLNPQDYRKRQAAEG